MIHLNAYISLEKLLDILHDGFPPLLGHHRRLNAPQNLCGSLLSANQVPRADRRQVRIRRHRVGKTFRSAAVRQRRPVLLVTHVQEFDPECPRSPPFHPTSQKEQQGLEDSARSGEELIGTDRVVGGSQSGKDRKEKQANG